MTPSSDIFETQFKIKNYKIFQNNFDFVIKHIYTQNNDVCNNFLFKILKYKSNYKSVFLFAQI